jgi:hypothetical protein
MWALMLGGWLINWVLRTGLPNFESWHGHAFLCHSIYWSTRTPIHWVPRASFVAVKGHKGECPYSIVHRHRNNFTWRLEVFFWLSGPLRCRLSVGIVEAAWSIPQVSPCALTPRTGVMKIRVSCTISEDSVCACECVFVGGGGAAVDMLGLRGEMGWSLIVASLFFLKNIFTIWRSF